MAVLILTGPSGAGKDTVSAVLAHKLDCCAVVDASLVRWMVLKPHRAVWDGEEGRAQLLLGVRNVCALTKNFVQAGFHVVVQDILTDETAQLYSTELAAYNPKIVCLLPPLEEVKRRNAARGAWLKEEEVEIVYGWQQQLKTCAKKIDNTGLSADDVAKELMSIIS